RGSSGGGRVRSDGFLNGVPVTVWPSSSLLPRRPLFLVLSFVIPRGLHRPHEDGDRRSSSKAALFFHRLNPLRLFRAPKGNPLKEIPPQSVLFVG
ncbi:hypothetical protein MUK42_11928, partial [Musa troglodytarum]